MVYATTMRILQCLGGVEAAAGTVPAAAAALPQFYVQERNFASANAEYTAYNRIRVPQFVNTNAMIAYLDCSVPDGEASDVLCHIAENAVWDQGIIQLSSILTDAVVSTNNDFRTDIYGAYAYSENRQIKSHRYTDRVTRAAMGIEFLNGPDDHARVMPSLRVNAGVNLAVSEIWLRAGGAGFDAVDGMGQSPDVILRPSNVTRARYVIKTVFTRATRTAPEVFSIPLPSQMNGVMMDMFTKAAEKGGNIPGPGKPLINNANVAAQGDAFGAPKFVPMPDKVLDNNLDINSSVAKVPFVPKAGEVLNDQHVHIPANSEEGKVNPSVAAPPPLIIQPEGMKKSVKFGTILGGFKLQGSADTE
jgi:hypothetical protein